MKTPLQPRRGKRRPRSRKRKAARNWQRRGLWATALGALCILVYAVYLDFQIRGRFEGRRWALSARVFARPLEIYADKALSSEAFIEELKLLRYRSHAHATAPGEYARSENAILLHTRGFPFWDGDEPQRRVRVEFQSGVITAVYDVTNDADLDLLRFEPVPIANIYPTDNEDRILVRLDGVPPLLIHALIAVEDRDFYDHYGLDFTALVRALLANIRAGRAVQGGSTLTQQLVKNYFLTNERTLWRKFNEAIMAVLLEWHYSKDEILEAYLNEVYLGQQGQRAIHGFALASQFYFQKLLSDLSPEQLALLVAMAKGPSYYDPRKYPERARERRNLVLSMLGERDHMDPAEVAKAKTRPLEVSERAPSGMTPFPAFLQLVRRQLHQDYRDEDLRSEGLMIFTTLDPLIQITSEQAMKARLDKLEAARDLAQHEMQAAVVVANVDNGEVLALVGGRDPRLPGYNRALDARRPVGSLIKPVVFLTALSQPERYTLATHLDDAPLSVRLSDDQLWSPQNYDRKAHGQVMLRDALVQSYNLSTARLGLAVGIDDVARNLRTLGLQRSVPEYPSLLLGAVEMSPLEVGQIYQTIASGGYRVPLRAIREVMNWQGVPLQRYPLNIEQVLDPSAAYLLTAALHEVTQQGTAKSLKALLRQDLQVAGKTGTTNGLRDSWFAGYSGEHLAVVWVGRDNNQPTGLSGATGALPVWGDIMRAISRQSLNMTVPANVEWKLIDPSSGLLADDYCTGAQWIPFIDGTAPKARAQCGRASAQPAKRTWKWLHDLFE